jgi:PAS domain S-box-containing protein
MKAMQNVGRFSIDWACAEVRDATGVIRLTAVQIKVLRLLVKARGGIVLKEKFHAEIWKDDIVEDGSLSQAIFMLRKALGKLPDGGDIIQTVPRRGYRLTPRALSPAHPGPLDSAELKHRIGLSGDEPFRLLVESIEDYAIYMLDCSGRVLTWNRGAEHNKGFGSAEVLGQHYSLFFVPEDVLARLPERELSIAATNGNCSGEGWRIRKSGERFWASFALTALRGEDGKLLGFAKVLRDLTEHKRHEDTLLRMEATLRRERDCLRAAAESSRDALFICEAIKDAKGEIQDFVFTYLNRNVESVVSIPREKLIGRKMCEMLPINLDLGLFDAYKQVVLTGNPFEAEVPVWSEHITGHWLRIQAARFEEGVAITASSIDHVKPI